VSTSPTTTTSATTAAAATTTTAAKPGLVALVLALLGVPGSTIAWELPAGGFWIGVPLAVAAIVVGARALGRPGRAGRRPAVAGIALAAVELLFMATWTVAG